MKDQLIAMSLFLTTLPIGFYGGTGFFTVIGNNPSILELTDANVAESKKALGGFS